MLFKKYPKLEEIQIKESWSIGQGIDNGNPFIVRINKGFKKFLVILIFIPELE